MNIKDIAENYATDKQNENASKFYIALESFIDGYQLAQQEQDKKLYSEEEVIELLNRREEYTSQAPKTDWFSISKWFEQFKDK